MHPGEGYRHEGLAAMELAKRENESGPYERAKTSSYSESYADFFEMTAPDGKCLQQQPPLSECEWFGPESDVVFGSIDEGEEILTVSDSGLGTAHSEIQRLLDLVEAQAKKLEAANYRIGYLESQSENYKERIALLTDGQSGRGWWRSLRVLFSGGGKQTI